MPTKSKRGDSHALCETSRGKLLDRRPRCVQQAAYAVTVQAHLLARKGGAHPAAERLSEGFFFVGSLTELKTSRNTKGERFDSYLCERELPKETKEFFMQKFSETDPVSTEGQH